VLDLFTQGNKASGGRPTTRTLAPCC
jgi:hypothetical protein